MQIIISGKKMDLTEPIKDYAQKKIEGLDKFYDKIIRAVVEVGVESNHHQKGKVFIAECKLEVPGKDLFASKNEKSLYKAIDKIRDYLEAELKKHKVLQREKLKRDKRKIREAKNYNPED